MKNYKSIIAVAVAGLTCLAVTSNAALTYNFVANGGGITFDGLSDFQLNPISGGSQFVGNDFGVDTGITGSVSGGGWAFDSTTGVVTGGGLLTLTDGTGFLTGNLTFGTISISGGSFGINTLTTSINVTGIAVSGAPGAVLLSIFGGTSGVFDITAQYTSQTTLATLAGSPSTTSFSGSFSTVPEPSTIVAGALMLLPFGIGAIRSLRKDRVA